mmetsp:Transcript_110110/g.307849  ORF Transcript_110110/g.307849 Transcript_110110/m.307849 type:complete len:202 (-) Transcript_110110:248-853(-)
MGELWEEGRPPSDGRERRQLRPQVCPRDSAARRWQLPLPLPLPRAQKRQRRGPSARDRSLPAEQPVAADRGGHLGGVGKMGLQLDGQRLRPQDGGERLGRRHRDGLLLRAEGRERSRLRKRRPRPRKRLGVQAHLLLRRPVRFEDDPCLVPGRGPLRRIAPVRALNRVRSWQGNCHALGMNSFLAQRPVCCTPCCLSICGV